MAGCSTCSSNGKVSGCQNNGGCLTGGCNKLNVFDWLSNMGAPLEQNFPIIEVRFKKRKKRLLP